jgi:hypothetical protein
MRVAVAEPIDVLVDLSSKNGLREPSGLPVRLVVDV